MVRKSLASLVAAAALSLGALSVSASVAPSVASAAPGFSCGLNWEYAAPEDRYWWRIVNCQNEAVIRRITYRDGTMGSCYTIGAGRWIDGTSRRQPQTMNGYGCY